MPYYFKSQVSCDSDCAKQMKLCPYPYLIGTWCGFCICTEASRRLSNFPELIVFCFYVRRPKYCCFQMIIRWVCFENFFIPVVLQQYFIFFLSEQQWKWFRNVLPRPCRLYSTYMMTLGIAECMKWLHQFNFTCVVLQESQTSKMGAFLHRERRGR